MTDRAALPANTIQHGNCIDLMQGLPSGSIDFILTDPPYFCRYRSRDGQRVANDDNGEWMKPAFAGAYRLSKPDSFCVSFYGWNSVDLFFEAWRAAGFRPVGHIVWQKDYASKAGFLEYRHEQAYLLAKGNPVRPGKALADVQPWEYSGNRSHPTEKAVSILTPEDRASVVS
jgi:adenine-specific DNA-methyltransferase